MRRLEPSSSFGRPAASSGSNGCAWLLGLGCLLALIVTVSGRGGSDRTIVPKPFVDPTPVAAGSAPAPPAPVEAANIRRANRHAELAVGAEGASGAMVYSVNCWASVERLFSPASLDRCGAFDALARRVSMNPLQFAPEAAWFDPEATAERFRAAAVAGGMDASLAGDRYALVMELADAEVLEPRAPSSSQTVMTIPDGTADDVDEVVNNSFAGEDRPGAQPENRTRDF